MRKVATITAVALVSTLSLLGSAGGASAATAQVQASEGQNCVDLSSPTGPAMHLSNSLYQNVYVLVSPNPDWAVADLVTDVGLMFVGVGEIKAATTVGKLPATIKSVRDLFEFLKVSGGLLSGTISAGSRSAEAVLEAVQLATNFKKKSLAIPAGQCRRISDTGILDYLNASGTAGLLGAKTKSLIVMTEDGKHVAEYNADPDTSWIARPAEIARAKYGTFWQKDFAGDHYDW